MENGNRINEPTDWIHYFYHPKNGWSKRQNVTHYRYYYWTHIRNLLLGDVTLINEDPYKKRAYTIYSKENNFAEVEEKDPFLVDGDKKLQGITVHKTIDVKYYVSEDYYLNRHKKFPNHYPIGMICSFYEKYVYEALNHNTTTGITLTKYDFILPTTRTKPSTNIFSFSAESEKYYWKNSTWSNQLKKLILTGGRRIVLYRYNTIKIKPDEFISALKKEILALMTPIFFKGLKDIKDNDSIQSSFFYMIVLTKQKKLLSLKSTIFLAIMCSFSFLET